MPKGGIRLGAGRPTGSGRPKKFRNGIKSYYRDADVKEFTKALKEMALTKKSSAPLIFILEQLFGKAGQRIEMTGKEGGPLKIEVAKEFAEKYNLIKKELKEDGKEK